MWLFKWKYVFNHPEPPAKRYYCGETSAWPGTCANFNPRNLAPPKHHARLRCASFGWHVRQRKSYPHGQAMPQKHWSKNAKVLGQKKAVLEVLGQKKSTLDTQVTHWHTASKRCQSAWLQTYRDWRIDRWIPAADRQTGRQTDRQAGMDGKVPLTAARKPGWLDRKTWFWATISARVSENQPSSSRHFSFPQKPKPIQQPLTPLPHELWAASSPTTDVNKVQLSSPADHKMQLIFWPPRKSIAPVRQNDFRHLMMSQSATPATQNDIARRLKPPKVRVLFHIQARRLQSFPSSLHMCAGVNFSFTSLLRCQSHWKVFSLWFFRAVNLASRCIINVCLVGGTCVDNVVSRTWSSGR